jgi:hypothetical protein
MAGRIVLGAMSQGIPLVRYYSQRASNAATQSAKVWKKPSKEKTLEGKKFKPLKNNEVPTSFEIMEDHSLLQDMIRYYKDPKKYSGK